MQLDQTTYNDLSIFHQEEEASIFHKINHTITLEGKEWLFRMFNTPFKSIKQIRETQEILKAILQIKNQWPSCVSNGTLMVMEKYYESNLDKMPENAHALNALAYKIFHGPDYAIVRYSVTHFADFLRGLKEVISLLYNEQAPLLLQSTLHRMAHLMNHPLLLELASRPSADKFSLSETIIYGSYLKENCKSLINELVGHFGKLDAWYGMATAMEKMQLHFPDFVEQEQPLLEAKQLFHILLPTPIPYDIYLTKDSNFIFLTGANMAGKSTFIKAVGSAVFMAHLGMGVPASNMKLTLFDGLLSNINMVDNIVKGESYFFNEVQRIRNTILKINDGNKWLVLIDELFKGTNVQDAMKCSTTVIKGLLKMRNSHFILSTHLYEIGEELKSYPNISFRYFETSVQDEQLSFSYQLKEGISNDRLGYLILKREKVVELLENL
jgi:DNA mismatch repair ATPase MutS